MRPVPPIGEFSRRGFVSSLLGAGAATIAGCSASEPAYYTLTPWAGTARPGGPLTVEVRTPSVAPYLDRDYIVRNDNDYRLRLDNHAAWASSLADMIGSTLALDLAQRLPGSNVYSQNSAISTEPLARVELDVSRFLEAASGRAEIEAPFSVFRPGSGPAGSRTLRLVRDPGGASIAALVAALSALVGQLADAVADALRALPPEPAAKGDTASR